MSSSGTGRRGPLRTLLGREPEISTIDRHVSDGVMVLTVCGAAGVGKSAVVGEVARRRAAAGAERAVEFDLRECAVAEIRARIAAARGRAGTRRLLVTLEGADEHRDAAAALADTVTHPDGVALLISTLAPLGVPGEHTVALRPLATPGEHDDLPAVARCSAVRLFLTRADESGLLFDRDGADLPAVGRICRLVGGLPLAIELAAARARALPLEVVEQQLADHSQALRLLVDRSGGSGRHASVRSALLWACSGLESDERRLLAELAVFSGAFTLEDAGAVSSLDIAEVTEPLSGLIDARLVDLEPDPAAPARFRLPHLVRALALDELNSGRAGTSSTSARRRLATLVISMVDAFAGAAREERDAAEAEERLLAHLPDVHAVLSRATEGDAAQALALAAGLVPFVIRNAEKVALRDQVAETLELVIASTGSDAWSAAQLIDAARLMFHMGAPRGSAHALELYERGLSLARSSADPHTVLRGLAVRVEAMRLTGDFAATADAVAEGLRVAERADAQRWLCRFEAWQGMVHHQQGEVPQALSFAASALARARRHKDGEGVLLAGILLAPMEDPAIDVPGGAPTLDELCQLSLRLGDARRRLVVLCGLFRRALAAGDITAAARWLEHRVDAVARRQWWDDLGLSLMDAALLATERGEDFSAARWHGATTPVLHLLFAMQAPVTAAGYDRVIEELRRRMGDEPFDAAVRAGAMVSWSELATELLSYAAAVAAEADRATEADATTSAALTTREREVLRVIAAGNSNKEAARLLSISAKTVMHHSVAIYRKLGVRGRAEATAWAVRHGYA